MTLTTLDVAILLSRAVAAGKTGPALAERVKGWVLAHWEGTAESLGVQTVEIAAGPALVELTAFRAGETFLSVVWGEP